MWRVNRQNDWNGICKSDSTVVEEDSYREETPKLECSEDALPLGVGDLQGF